MLTQLRKRKEGFTIIEVLIVLAIAGLILLVVFLAVPALQRNSRNTQRKSEVASIVGAINEYSNNNGGKLPTGAQLGAAVQNAKLSFYEASDVTAASSDTNGSSTETVQVRLQAKCGTNGNAASSGASARQFAVLYNVETGGGEQKLCQDS